MSRRLTLRTERLTELTPEELTGVNGGGATVPCPYTLGLCVVRTLNCFVTLENC